MSKKEILAWIYYYGFLEITIAHLDSETLRNCAMLALDDGILSGYHCHPLISGSKIFVLREDDPSLT